MSDPVISLNGLFSEYDTLSRAIDKVDQVLAHYAIESMEGQELDAAIHYLDAILEPAGHSFEAYSVESDTPASDAALAGTNTTTPTRGERVKKFAETASATMKEKLRKLPEEIKKYATIVMETMTSSTKGLANTAKQLLDQLDNVENTAREVSGNYAIFNDTRPQAALASLRQGVASLGKESEKALEAIGKLRDGASSDLTLLSYKGTEFKFDGTSKFFDSKLDNEKTDIRGLSKADVKLVCERVIQLSEEIESAKTNLPDITAMIQRGVRQTSSAGAKDTAKHTFAMGTFYRQVIGGYIRYTIKVSKLALAYANGSLNATKGD